MSSASSVLRFKSRSATVLELFSDGAFIPASGQTDRQPLAVFSATLMLPLWMVSAREFLLLPYC